MIFAGGAERPFPLFMEEKRMSDIQIFMDETRECIDSITKVCESLTKQTETLGEVLTASNELGDARDEKVNNIEKILRLNSKQGMILREMMELLEKRIRRLEEVVYDGTDVD
jgi:hypothetical protein